MGEVLRWLLHWTTSVVIELNCRLAHDLSERFGLLPMLKEHSNTYLWVVVGQPEQQLHACLLLNAQDLHDGLSVVVCSDDLLPDRFVHACALLNRQQCCVLIASVTGKVMSNYDGSPILTDNLIYQMAQRGIFVFRLLGFCPALNKRSLSSGNFSIQYQGAPMPFYDIIKAQAVRASALRPDLRKHAAVCRARSGCWCQLRTISLS
jgi:hypothetical protein